MTLHEDLRELGWAFGQTGGGCTAYTKGVGMGYAMEAGYYLLMTERDTADAPSDWRQYVTVTLYDDYGEPVFDFNCKLSAILRGTIQL